MKIAILSMQPSTKRAHAEELRLKAEAKALGHTARIFRADRCQLVYEQGKPFVLHDLKPFPAFDVVIPRASVTTNVELRCAIVKQLQLMGFRMLNDYLAISRAKNKLRTMQILAHHHVPTPRTMVIRTLADIDEAIKYVGGLPVIIKTPFGSYGSGVVIAESKRSVYSALDLAMKSTASDIIMIQQYISESKGSDVRVFVVGGKVVGAMVRQAKRGEFRSNMELGGTGAPIDPDDATKEVALRAVEALKLHVAGVDVIQTKDGPAVLEVNANPGFKGLEQTTQLNIAREIVTYAVKYAKSLKKEPDRIDA